MQKSVRIKEIKLKIEQIEELEYHNIMLQQNFKMHSGTQELLKE
jgi:hypothetical protein